MVSLADGNHQNNQPMVDDLVDQSITGFAQFDFVGIL